ncbi:ChbG/HpnK family deacetylase [Algoriphagus antarcticus]|uniref:YdjC-like protein n=1 Tax=Algoriphagus antarcticus TaxID=238540 RepID=A0A3E0EB37_9BACT|nr:ChbG/HpnK family deacetylase [Algoriphagus antarcticus]REG94459.1 YdjC-like protein [Algoriphagus antarcticus]
METFKGIVSQFVNVRLERPSVNAPKSKVLAPGSEVEISHAIVGEEYLDSSIWYVLSNHSFVWSKSIYTTSEVPLIEKKIIVTADDIGIVEEIDVGAKIALREGWINSIAVLVNRPDDHNDSYLSDFCQSLMDFPKEDPEHSLYKTTHIGLHFTITSGEPISEPKEVQLLIDSEKKFLDFRKFNRNFEKPDYVEQVKTEFLAQYEKFKRVFGREPDHLTSHHDVLTFNHPLFSFMQNWSREKSIPLRNHRFLPRSKRFWYDTLALMNVNLPSINKMNNWESSFGPFTSECSQHTIVDHYGPIPPFGITSYEEIVSKKQKSLDNWMKDFLISKDSQREIVIHLIKSGFRSQSDFVGAYKSLRNSYPGIEIKYFDGRVAEYLSLQKNCFWNSDPWLALHVRS